MSLKNSVNLDGRKIEYKIRKNKRAKYLKLSVDNKAELTVTVPGMVPGFLVRKFILEKSSWVLKSIIKMEKKKKDRENIKYGAYKINKEKARKIICKRVRFFADKHDFSFNKISIRNQKSRWGSCSSQGNLNFNYKLIFLPPRLADYVIVHELCHLREMNHSRNFWKLLEEIMPDWKERRSSLKKINLTKN